ncbi:hypothetical protein AB0L75_36485 [Streptomyces sp. NPDC052101]|uniref:hypothetical protein n=1 Tax=Streptomyces sp. NPDC052101 TaxID=3155763 RepID=UPI00341F7ADF
MTGTRGRSAPRGRRHPPRHHRRRAGPVDAGRWYDLRVEVDGRHIRCYRDGELLHDIEDVRPEPEVLAVSAVRGSAHGDVITEIAHATAETVTARLRLAGTDGDTQFTRTMLAARPHATSPFAPARASPVEDRVTGPVRDLPPCSFTVLRTRTESVVRARSERDQR